jgi:hypothetical protein
VAGLVVKRDQQLRLSRPAQRAPEMRRLTARQRELLGLLRAAEPHPDGSVPTSSVAWWLGYAQPSAACDRLVRRGLAKKVRPGVYKAVVLRERKP